MATATAMYHSGLNPLKGISRDARKGERVDVVKGDKRRRLHKAFLRYHDPNNWPLLREALKSMGRADLIGNGKHHLIPTWQPATDGGYQSARRTNSTPAPVAGRKPAPRSAIKGQASTPADPRPIKGRVLTQHTGLPPRDTGSRPAVRARPAKPPRKSSR
jgi:hypothetical protein